jgi:hypothetical protein
MGNEEHGAVVLLQQRFEKLQGFDVEIVEAVEKPPFLLSLPIMYMG